MIETVLGQAEGNQTLAAAMLGINRNTLRKKMQQLRIKGVVEVVKVERALRQRLGQVRHRRARPRAGRARRRRSSPPAAPPSCCEKEGVRGHRGLGATPASPRCWTAASRRCTRRSTAACSRGATTRDARRGDRAARASRRSTSSWSTSIRSQATVADPDCTLDDAIENIDIGGPAMLRSAAKNYARRRGGGRPGATTPRVLEELKRERRRRATRRASRSPRRRSRIPPPTTARSRTTCPRSAQTARAASSRRSCNAAASSSCRTCATARTRTSARRSTATLQPGAPARSRSCRQLQGKELSYNNIADADAAWECVKSFDEPACVIVKHANPCGVAVGANAARRLRQGLRAPIRPRPSAASSPSTARSIARPREAIGKQFVEVLIAPAHRSREARKATRARRRTCACSRCRSAHEAAARTTSSASAAGCWCRRSDARGLDATRAEGRDAEKAHRRSSCDDLLFAWRVAKFVKSNAIVFCRDGATLGVGAGQMSRVDSARIAAIKAQNAGLDARGLGGRRPTPSSRSATASTRSPTPAPRR